MAPETEEHPKTQLKAGTMSELVAMAWLGSGSATVVR
jgi:hypothetical protein